MMSAFGQTVIITLITYGGASTLADLIKFFTKRKDEKTGKKSATVTALEDQSRKIDELSALVQKVADTQEDISSEVGLHGTAIAGLEHDRIIHIGESYLKKGHISVKEYNDLDQYLYEPYKKLGGNGTAEAIMGQLSSIISERSEEDET